jgi:hypothetical protein
MSRAYRVITAEQAVDEFSIDENDILVNPITGLPMASWSKDGTIVNKIDASYDFNETTKPNDFSRRRFYTAERSVDRYTAQVPLTGTFRGIHTDLGGGAILDRLAILYLQRWGYPPPILIFSITYRRHIFEALDEIRITHSKIPNFITGNMGLTSERFEILSVSPTWGLQGRLDIVAVWIGAIESSAVPTSGGTLSLVPGESTVDITDTNIPFAASIDLTTPGAAVTHIRVGLKGLSYRTWQCFFEDGVLAGEACISLGSFWDEVVFNTQVTYHMDYKISTAPNVPGSAGNPSTGWIPLLVSTTRGNTAQVSLAKCNGVASIPTEDVWSHDFPTLAGTPAIYNVRVFFDAITAQGDPCPTHHAGGEFFSACSPTGFACMSNFLGSAMTVDAKRLTVDFIEGII